VISAARSTGSAEFPMGPTGGVTAARLEPLHHFAGLGWVAEGRFFPGDAQRVRECGPINATGHARTALDRSLSNRPGNR